jgi:hypothetical protein
MEVQNSDVWDNVNLPKPAADKLPADWDQRESKATVVIGLAVEDSQLIHLLTSTSEHKMWLKLQRIHERSMCSKLSLIRKLYSACFTSGTMTAHVTAMLQIMKSAPGFRKRIY